ncbi:MAG: hypothetical protein WAK83_17760 [Trebonia sp.]|uniref:hypothetical protein n=1 Tax=Trebonia sp. TaxID=2767075 RepID=UPI003BB1C123
MRDDIAPGAIVMAPRADAGRPAGRPLFIPLEHKEPAPKNSNRLSSNAVVRLICRDLPSAPVMGKSDMAT